MVDDGKQEQEILEVPDVMKGGDKALQAITALQQDMKNTAPVMDDSKYRVMQGMQDESKLDFFTELINDDDVLRCNTIEAYIMIAPLVVRKCSPNTWQKIRILMSDVYGANVKTHKRNMVSKGRQREKSYTKILSNDATDTINQIPTGARKFFGNWWGKK